MIVIFKVWASTDIRKSSATCCAKLLLTSVIASEWQAFFFPFPNSGLNRFFRYLYYYLPYSIQAIDSRRAVKKQYSNVINCVT